MKERSRDGKKASYESGKRQESLHTDGKARKKGQPSTKIIKRRNQIMTLDMYAIKDELNGFTCPIPLSNDAIAARYLKDQYETNPTVKNSPEHFSIYKVGTFDTETGIFETIDPIRKGDAKNYADN